jgi:multicomponent Na+:H+ antiporter subunit F
MNALSLLALTLAQLPPWFLMIIQGAIIILAISSLLPLRRILIGPSLADRSIALDVLLADAMAIVALFSILHETDRYLPMILLLILLGFTGAVCFGRFLETGQVFEGDLDLEDPKDDHPTEDSLE